MVSSALILLASDFPALLSPRFTPIMPTKNRPTTHPVIQARESSTIDRFSGCVGIILQPRAPQEGVGGWHTHLGMLFI